uniref:Uncharacterized protein n=1 Tax=Anopheles farauti TaxID=69004 RepID=A0A182Q8S3_9DIPT
MERLPEYLRDTVDWFMGYRVPCGKRKMVSESRLVALLVVVVCGCANNDGGPSASASNLSKIMGGSGIILPLDVEETVTCFCSVGSRPTKEISTTDEISP